MEPGNVAPALRERLGDPGTSALLDLLQLTGRAWRDEVLETAVDRLERRLGEELGKLRLEMAGLRQDMTQGDAALRHEMVEDRAALRQEMAAGFSALREDIAHARADLMKWSFMFWIGQFAAFTAMAALMLRIVAGR